MPNPFLILSRISYTRTILNSDFIIYSLLNIRLNEPLYHNNHNNHTHNHCDMVILVTRKNRKLTPECSDEEICLYRMGVTSPMGDSYRSFSPSYDLMDRSTDID